MAQVVLVHGNPETTAIWDPLLAALGRDDVETLSPPGFGAPVPEGFGATTDDYVAWLVGELEAKGAPVDLVGHDWGGGHWAWFGLTDIHQGVRSPGEDAHHGDHGEEEASPSPVVHPGVQG